MQLAVRGQSGVMVTLERQPPYTVTTGQVPLQTVANEQRRLPDEFINADGVVHYHGVTVEGEYTVHGVMPGQAPIDRTMPVTGLYLGPCDSE